MLRATAPCHSWLRLATARGIVNFGEAAKVAPKQQAALKAELELIPAGSKYAFFKWAKTENNGDVSRAAIKKFAALPTRERHSYKKPNAKWGKVGWKKVMYRELGLAKKTKNMTAGERLGAVSRIASKLPEAKRKQFEKMAAAETKKKAAARSAASKKNTKDLQAAVKKAMAERKRNGNKTKVHDTFRAAAKEYRKKKQSGAL